MAWAGRLPMGIAVMLRWLERNALAKAMMTRAIDLELSARGVWSDASGGECGQKFNVKEAVPSVKGALLAFGPPGPVYA